MEKYKQLIDNILPTEKYGCCFRLVEEDDAKFILTLRTDEKLSRFISSTSFKIEDQIQWLNEYKIRENKGEEFYIIASDNSGNRLGLNRIYNLTNEDFEIGSWLYKSNLEHHISILGDLFVRSIAFELFKYKKCKFEVRKGNKSVLRYHYLFKPIITGEDDKNYYFQLDYNSFLIQKIKFLKLFGYD